MSVRVLLVDSNASRRAELERLLARYPVVSVTEPAQVPAGPFDVALLSHAQATGHGLELGRTLKRRDKSTYVVVYGRPPAGLTVGPTATTTWEVDKILAPTAQATDILAVIESKLHARLRAERNAAQAAANPGWGELLKQPVSKESMKKLLTKDILK